MGDLPGLSKSTEHGKEQQGTQRSQEAGGAVPVKPSPDK